MLRWLPSQEGLDTLDNEGARARDDAQMARMAPVRPGTLARFADALRSRLDAEHSLTGYPCRMPDGSLGRTAIRLVDGDWVAVCVLPRAMGQDALAASPRAEATWAARSW